jgi:adenylate cyclase
VVVTISSRVAGDFDAATEMVDRAIVLNPNLWVAWEQRGETFNSTGNFQEAIRSFERAIRLSPLDPIVFATYTGLGLAFIGLGRFDEAIVAAKKKPAPRAGLFGERTFSPRFLKTLL